MGVSVDTFAAAGHYAEHLALKFPLLGDWPRYETGKWYGVFVEERSLFRRVTFVIDAHGIVRARIEDRDPAQHPRLALQVVRSLR